MTTKPTDSKGRIALAPAVPQREAWLHKNSKAKAAVLRGLEEAKAGKMTKSPDLEADARLMKRLDD